VFHNAVDVAMKIFDVTKAGGARIEAGQISVLKSECDGRPRMPNGSASEADKMILSRNRIVMRLCRFVQVKPFEWVTNWVANV
jgi:hypothetical protein